METEVDDFLAHFGVKGMKWGVRKERTVASGGSKSTEKMAGKKTSAGDVPEKTRDKNGRLEKSKPEAPKTAKTMSDAELRSAINRIRMEQEYATLTKAPPTAKDKAKAAVEEILWDVGKKQTKSLLNNLATQQIKKASGLDTKDAKSDKKNDKKSGKKSDKTSDKGSDKTSDTSASSEKTSTSSKSSTTSPLRSAEYTRAKMDTEALLAELGTKKPIRELSR